MIDRLLQARRHQITLAQLFGMSNEEAAAFREVVKQVGGDYERLVSLATSDLLTPTERKAVDKATSVVTDLRRLTEEMPMDVQTRFRCTVARRCHDAAIGARGVHGGQPGAPRRRWAAAGRGGKCRSRSAERPQAAAEDAPPPGVSPPAARSGRAGTAGGRGGARGGRGRGVLQGANTDTLDATQREAVTKLNACLGSAGDWFWRTVFPTE